MTQELTITQPDDWHLHVRDGAALNTVVPHTAKEFARAIIMPNLKPPVTTAKQAAEYKQRILQAVPKGLSFEPLMTLYLTDNLPADEIARAKDAGVVAARAVAVPAGGAAVERFVEPGAATQQLPASLATLASRQIPILPPPGLAIGRPARAHRVGMPVVFTPLKQLAMHLGQPIPVHQPTTTVCTRLPQLRALAAQAKPIGRVVAGPVGIEGVAEMERRGRPRPAGRLPLPLTRQRQPRRQVVRHVRLEQRRMSANDVGHTAPVQRQRVAEKRKHRRQLRPHVQQQDSWTLFFVLRTSELQVLQYLR